MSKRLCQFPECGRPHASHGYCYTHWTHLKKGRPLLPIQQPDYSKDWERMGRAVALQRQGMGLDEAAAAMGISRWAVRALVAKARRRVSQGKDQGLTAEDVAWVLAWLERDA